MSLFKIVVIFLFVSQNLQIKAVTLDNAIQMAHENADQIAIQSLNLDLSKAEVTNALQKFLPRISYGFQRGTGTLTTSLYPGESMNYDIKNDTFSVKEDLSLHRIIPEYIVKQKTLQSNIAKYQMFLSDFTLLVVENYIGIIIARENLALAKDLDLSIASMNHDATIKNIIGSINVIEFLGIESRYDDSKARVIQAEMQVQQLESIYKLYTKSQPGNLSIPHKFILPTTTLQDYLAMVNETNKTLEDIKNRIIVTDSAKFASYADIFMPKLSAEYADMKSIFPFFAGAPSFRQKQFVTSAEFEIYDKGEKFTNVSKANIANRIVEREMLLEREKLQIKANNMWANHHSLYLLTQAKRKDLEVEQARVNIAKAKFKNRSISLVDMVKTQVNFYNAKINYLTTYKEFVLNYYKLLAML